MAALERPWHTAPALGVVCNFVFIFLFSFFLPFFVVAHMCGKFGSSLFALGRPFDCVCAVKAAIFMMSHTWWDRNFRNSVPVTLPKFRKHRWCAGMRNCACCNAFHGGVARGAIVIAGTHAKKQKEKKQNK